MMVDLSTYRPALSTRIGGKDWSGLSYDVFSGHMLCIRNSKARIGELDAHGKMVRQTKRLDLKDPEDLAVYASTADSIMCFVVEERPNHLALVHLDRKSFEVKDIWRWSLGESVGNRGPEGIAIDVDGAHLLIVYEKPPRLLKIAVSDIDWPTPQAGIPDLSIPQHQSIDGIKDASAIMWSDGETFVLSDDSKCIVSLGAKRQRLELEHRQAEGVAFDGDGRLWVLGEPDELVIFEASREGGSDRARDGNPGGVVPRALLPSHQAPTEVFDDLGFAGEVFALFDATESSKRHYDWVHPLDGLTFWCAHWHSGKGAKVFSALHKDRAAWAAFVERAGEVGLPERDLARLRTKAWWQQFDRDRHKVYDEEPWLPKLLTFAGRDPVIARWQFGFWALDVLAEALTQCAVAGIDTKGGAASMASANSSAGSWCKQIARGMKPGAPRLEFHGGRWKLDPLPTWADDNAQDYKALVVWRAYAQAKGKIRSRMRAIWDAYYAATWGGLPSRDKRARENWTFRPTHSGVAMTLL